MLVLPPTLGGLGETNVTASSRDGTTVTASSSTHTKGSYATLVATTTKPSYGFWLRVKGVAASNTNTSMLLDIAIGDSPSGGNEERIVANIDVGAASANATSGGKVFYFPAYIPSGVSVRAAIQAAIASDTCTVDIFLNQDPSYRWSSGAVQTYGANTATSNGTSVTPASGSFGSWTQIGTGTDPIRNHRFWSVGYSLGTDTTIVAASVLVEIGTGPDSSNVSTIGRFLFNQASTEEIAGPIPQIVYAPVVAGGELWARIASAEAEARSISIYGSD